MADQMTNFEKPDILTTIKNEHIEVKKSGNRYVTLSPFREERHPSFFIYPDNQRWYDFGMGKGGDVVDFISLYKGLSFKDSLKYLGINGKPYKPDPKEKHKRELLQQFKVWCMDYFNDLTGLYRCLQIAKEKIKNVEEAEAISGYYHRESKWLSHIEILTSRNDREKFELYCQVTGGSS